VVNPGPVMNSALRAWVRSVPTASISSRLVPGRVLDLARAIAAGHRLAVAGAGRTRT
jgi:hypothetical protein